MLLCLTANHRTAGFDLLERLSAVATSVAGVVPSADDRIRGAVILATCNRFEAYLDVAAGGDEALTAETLAEVADNVARAVAARVDPGHTDAEQKNAEQADAEHQDAELLADSEAAVVSVDAVQLAAALRHLVGNAVAEHLFAVSSGLESVVVGEGEIAGQVRRALESARGRGTSTPELELVFQRAARAAREVKGRTALGGAGRSVVRLALDLTASRIADWRDLRVLLVGTGAYAGASLAALRDRGVDTVAVYSPSGRAGRFSLRHGIAAIEQDGLVDAIAAADLVITCTAAPGYVLDPDTVSAALATGSDGRGRLIVDLGLPRNVDPAVSTLPGVELLDLETIRLHAPLPDLSSAHEARTLVRAAATEYAARRREDQVRPAVVAFRAHLFDLLDDEIRRARRRGDTDERTERALRHLVSRLVHEPSVRARELARTGETARFVSALEALYGIRPAAPLPTAQDAEADSGADRGTGTGPN